MNDETVEQVRDLIKINVDSSKGFEQAAETIESEPIALLFRQIAKDRRHHLQQLRRLVEISDEDADDCGSIRGTVHRWWLTARGTLNGGDDHVVLIEAERGEDAIKRCYEAALEIVDDPAVKRVLGMQYVEVKRGHDAVRGLRDMASME